MVFSTDIKRAQSVLGVESAPYSPSSEVVSASTWETNKPQGIIADEKTRKGSKADLTKSPL